MTDLRLLAITLLLLVAGTARAELRTFDIEPQYQQEVFSALTDILTPDPERGLIMEARGRVELLPSGQILVNASVQTLDQVEQVLEAIRSRSAAAAPRASLRYWAVLGATAPANEGFTRGTPPPAVLDAVLDELKRPHGELDFRVIGSAALTTASGQYGEVDGVTLSIEQTAYVQDNTLNAQISMRLQARAPPPMVGVVDVGSVEIRTTLERGEFVVLGESQAQGVGLDGPVFFIVHWER